MSIPAQAPIPFLSEADVERLLALPTLPPSTLTPLSSPLPHIPSPPLPISPPPLPANLTHPLGYRTAMIRLRAESPSTSYQLPLPPPIILSHTRASMRAAAPSTYILAPPSETPPFLLPSTDHRSDVLEVVRVLCIAPGPKFEIGESSSAHRPTGGFRRDYGFVATLDDEIRRDPEREVGYRIIDTWDEMVEATQEVMALRTTVLAQQAGIRDLRAADRARQAQLVETLTLMRTLQTHVTTLQNQQGPASGPAQPMYQRRPIVVLRFVMS
ncbi:hypothetical protein Tco_1050562 [Tanacetum coccineum]